LMPQDAAFKQLEHAVTCPACAEELDNALHAVGENTSVAPELQKGLRTASPAWQRQFAAKIASGGISAERVPSRRVLPFLFRPQAMAAMAAVVLLAVGAGLIWRLRAGSPDALIRQAYAQQRTIEMRIPGAGYGPIQVERANAKSPINSPRALLEAEVAIKSGMEKAPDDPDLLRMKAEADLLTWNYQPAIETLNHASHIRPSSFPLLIDLATAYFERAEASSSPADYEAGLEYLGEAVRLEPSNPAALFNRAILYERLYFYDRAIADWEQFLKLEQDPRWRDEGERRLKEIRSRLRERGERRDPDKLSLPDFQHEIEADRSPAIEEYLEAAERQILPNIAAPVLDDEHYRVSVALAQKLRSLHSDSFLIDLLRSAGQPEFKEAAQFLSQSSIANHSGRFELAYQEASRAAALFRRTGNSAGWLASLFEQAYARQFESQGDDCRKLAAAAAGEAHKLGYAFLEVQLGLENAICSNMSDSVGPAKAALQLALAEAKQHDYQSLYLRGLSLLVRLESEAGDDASAGAAVREGLALYWKSAVPPVRAYSLYAELDVMAERLGHPHVQFAALSEALGFRGENSNRVVEAAVHARVGDAALRIGDLTGAEAQLAQAQRLFASLPQTDSVRWREIEARVNLARVQSLRGADPGPIETALTNSLPDVQRLSNRYVEFLYYDTLAELRMRAGDTAAASRFLELATRMAELGARSLSTWQERQAWMELHRRPFAAMTAFLLESGRVEQALAEWQRYRSVGNPQLTTQKESQDDITWQRVSASQASPHIFSETRVLTYSFGPDGLMIWVRHDGEIHAMHLAVSTREVQRTADNFILECSRPDSDFSDLRADARSLYQWLIQPVQHWLPPSGHLIIEPDGVLGTVPWEALMDENSAYLGSRYAVSVALTLKATDDPGLRFAVQSSDHVLIVAAPALSDGPPAPPGALDEAARVAAHFNHPVMLVGHEAGVREVERGLGASAIFHFAGHAQLDRNGGAMLLADGPLGVESSAWSRTHRLDHLQLAVFSACATARHSETSESRSLVSEFLQRGAHNVVASRWDVDSIATTDFVELFYQSVLSGHSVAQAMQSAAGAFRQTRERAHPYYWAAFTAFGAA
jgi:CHAT domain-containing protein